jgi:hypothetical protein
MVSLIRYALLNAQSSSIGISLLHSMTAASTDENWDGLRFLNDCSRPISLKKSESRKDCELCGGLTQI